MREVKKCKLKEKKFRDTARVLRLTESEQGKGRGGDANEREAM